MNKTMTFVASGLFGLAALGAQADAGDSNPAFDVAGTEAGEHPEAPHDPDPAG